MACSAPRGSPPRGSMTAAIPHTRRTLCGCVVGVERGTARGLGHVSADELLERAWDENADPFTNAVRITVSGLRKRLGEPWIIATVAGAGYRIDTQAATERDRAWIEPLGVGPRGAPGPSFPDRS